VGDVDDDVPVTPRGPSVTCGTTTSDVLSGDFAAHRAALSGIPPTGVFFFVGCCCFCVKNGRYDQSSVIILSRNSFEERDSENPRNTLKKLSISHRQQKKQMESQTRANALLPGCGRAPANSPGAPSSPGDRLLS